MVFRSKLVSLHLEACMVCTTCNRSQGPEQPQLHMLDGMQVHKKQTLIKLCSIAYWKSREEQSIRKMSHSITANALQCSTVSVAGQGARVQQCLLHSMHIWRCTLLKKLENSNILNPSLRSNNTTIYKHMPNYRMRTMIRADLHT